MSVALNPKLLEKPQMPEASEVKLEIPVKNLSLIDTERLRETLDKTQQILTDSVHALRSLYDITNTADKTQIAETLQKTREVAESFEEIKQVLNQIWQQVSKDSEKRNLAYDAIIRELGK